VDHCFFLPLGLRETHDTIPAMATTVIKARTANMFKKKKVNCFEEK
jgi:hypothetical protein